jgi:hypothetical protein
LQSNNRGSDLDFGRPVSARNDPRGRRGPDLDFVRPASARKDNKSESHIDDFGFARKARPMTTNDDDWDQPSTKSTSSKSCTPTYDESQSEHKDQPWKRDNSRDPRVASTSSRNSRSSSASRDTSTNSLSSREPSNQPSSRDTTGYSFSRDPRTSRIDFPRHRPERTHFDGKNTAQTPSPFVPRPAWSAAKTASPVEHQTPMMMARKILMDQVQPHTPFADKFSNDSRNGQDSTWSSRRSSEEIFE